MPTRIHFLPLIQILGVRTMGQTISNGILDGASATVNYQLKQIIPAKRYFRLQPNLEPVGTAMDNASVANISRLRLMAEALLRKKGRLENFVRTSIAGLFGRKTKSMRPMVIATPRGWDRRRNRAICVEIYGGYLTIIFTDVSATIPTLTWSEASPLRVSAGRRKFT